MIDDLYGHAAIDDELHKLLENANQLRIRTVHRTVFERMAENKVQPDDAERDLIIEQAREAQDAIIEAAEAVSRSLAEKDGAD